MRNKPIANKDLEEVKKVKVKYFDIPDESKAQIILMTEKIDQFIRGVVSGLGIKGGWSFDSRNLRIIVKDTNDGKEKRPGKKVSLGEIGTIE